MVRRTLNEEQFDLVEELFHRAAELVPQERLQLLAKAAPDSGEVRALVLELLADHDQLEADDSGASAGAEDDLKPGIELGEWRLLEPLGGGGMAVVYRAVREVADVRLEAAIKVIRRGVASAESLERFSQEQRIAASLDHPSIAKLIDCGVTSDGRPYFALELVEGESIDTYCDGRRLELEGRVRLAAAVGRALHYAHQNLLIHRDLKPSNVLVDRGGRVRLLDFGIAKALDAESSLGGVETRTGRLPMTPRYASPEQLTGGQLTTASDQYQLGLLLFELITGRSHHLLDGERPMDIHRCACEMPTPRPSRFFRASSSGGGSETHPTLPEIAELRASGVGELRRLTRGDLDTIVLRALEKEPERRYSSVAALVEDLERYLERRPIRARPPSLGYRASKWIERNRALAALAGAVALTALALAAWLLVDRRQDAELRRLTLRFEDEAVQIEQYLRNARLRPRHDMRRERGQALDRLNRLEVEIGSLGVLARGPGHYALGRGYLALGELDAAIAHLETAWAEDFRANGMRLALGSALSEKYRHERARRYPPDIRRGRLEALDRELRDPALDLLRSVESPLRERTALLEAQIAFAEDRTDDALEASRRLAESNPWLYEARKLEAEILIVEAGREINVNDLSRAYSHLQAAGEALAVAREMARSDVALYRTECQRRMWELERLELVGSSFEEVLAAGETACAEAAEIRPDLAGILVDAATLYLGTPLGDRAFCRRACVRMRELAMSALSLDPEHPHALHRLSIAEMNLASASDPGGAGPLYESALSNMRKASEQLPEDPDLAAGVGLAHLTFGAWKMRRGADPSSDFEACIARATHSVKNAPEWSYGWFRLATCHLLSGIWHQWLGRDPSASFVEASRVAETGFELAPRPELAARRVDANFGLAVAKIETGDELAGELELAESLLALLPSVGSQSDRFTIFRPLLCAARAAVSVQRGTDAAVLAADWGGCGAMGSSRPAIRFAVAQTELSTARWRAGAGDLRASELALGRALESLAPRDGLSSRLIELQLRAEAHRRRAALRALRGLDPTADVEAGLALASAALSKTPELWGARLELVCLSIVRQVSRSDADDPSERRQAIETIEELMTTHRRLEAVLRPYLNLLSERESGSISPEVVLRELASLPAALPVRS